MSSRRQFLQAAAAGAGIVTMPAWLAACAKTGSIGSPLGSDSFLSVFGIDEALCRTLLADLSASGADAADVYFQRTRSNSIQMEDGKVSEASASIDQGVGLRTVVGDQQGYAFTEELTAESMRAAARTASSIARGTARPGPQALRSAGGHEGLYSLQVPWSAIGVDQKLPIVRSLEAYARAADPAVSRVSVSWNDSEEHILIATLDGRLLTEVRPMTRLWCTVTATRDGKTFSNSANLAGRRGIEWYTDTALRELAKQAVDRTMVLFDARRPPAGEMPVVLAAGASGILLHEAIGHGLEADFNRAGTSIYSDMVGKAIAAPFVDIVDNGVLPNERGALSFDDEGNPTERTVLVEKGILKGYLHDSISARHYGVTPSGSGRRQSFRFQPMPRMRCTYMENGPHTREEIIASVQNGIIAETFTNGQVQIGAGDYTFYIKNGWLIEGGKITAPIKDVNIIGNGPESLKRVTMAANDTTLDTGGWTCGKDGQGVPVSQGQPTVLVSGMTVGGENV
jgi:TldD protein